MNTVALFADRWILPGLHATLASLLANANPALPLRIVIFGEALADRERELLNRTAAPWSGPHLIEIHEFLTPVTRQLKSLRGNYTTYGRLFLPELLPETDVCLYLDCDLIVTRPVDPLFALARSGRPLYAEGTGVRRDSIDHPLFRAVGMDLSGPYFNCGVLVMNLDRWRAEGLTERCLTFAARHSALLLSADQSVLNGVFGDSFGTFGPEFNTLLWPSEPSVPESNRRGRIFHFVGTPKPWDHLGQFANRNYALWREWVSRSAWLADWRSRVTANLGVRRSLRVAPATFRELRRQFI